jgi:hypothetical protein
MERIATRETSAETPTTKIERLRRRANHASFLSTREKRKHGESTSKRVAGTTRTRIVSINSNCRASTCSSILFVVPHHWPACLLMPRHELLTMDDPGFFVTLRAHFVTHSVPRCSGIFGSKAGEYAVKRGGVSSGSTSHASRSLK